MKLIKFSLIGAIVLLFSITFTGCKKKDNAPADNSINFFSIEDDKALGLQVSQQIASDPAQFPILDENQYPEAYGHINRIRDSILLSGKVRYKDEFKWETKIIEDDSTLNAFATPGGYIYVYTGLIKFLEAEDEFAGVMGHEIAHADRRHSTDQLTKQYGIGTLIQIAFGGDPGLVAGVTASLLNLSFSRSDESEADEFSVIYLYETAYDARGAAGFFERLNSASGPEFLSTHPNPDDRVENIHEKWMELGGKVGQTFESSYQDFKNSLP